MPGAGRRSVGRQVVYLYKTFVMRKVDDVPEALIRQVLLATGEGAWGGGGAGGRGGVGEPPGSDGGERAAWETPGP